MPLPEGLSFARCGNLQLTVLHPTPFLSLLSAQIHRKYGCVLLSVTRRTAVLADADALSSCYGVGEVFLPDSLSTIVELGFTSSIRFLQPGLLLHGRPAPHSSGSVDEAPGFDFPGSQLVHGLMTGWRHSLAWLRPKGDRSASSTGGSRGHSMDGSNLHKQHQQERGPGVQQAPDRFLNTGSPIGTRPPSPLQALQAKQQQDPQSQQPPQTSNTPQQQQQRRQQPFAWPWHQQLHFHRQQQQQHRAKLPRSSWRHRKEIEEAGQLEVRGMVMKLLLAISMTIVLLCSIGNVLGLSVKQQHQVLLLDM